MKPLTKTAIVATLAGIAILYLSSQVTRSMISDGHRVAPIVLWHAPFFGYVRLPAQAYGAIVLLWLASVSIPPILWIAVGIKSLFSKSDPQRSAGSAY